MSDENDSPSVLKRIDNFVRGAANGLSFGFADKAAAALDGLFNEKTYAENSASEALRTADAAKDPAYHAGVAAGVVLPLVATDGASIPAAVEHGSAKLTTEVARLSQVASDNSFVKGVINGKMEVLENASDSFAINSNSGRPALAEWSALGQDLCKVGRDYINTHSVSELATKSLTGAAKAAADATVLKGKLALATGVASGASAEYMALPANNEGKTPGR